VPDAPLLRVRDLRVEYLGPRGSVAAVDGVSFDLARGETLGLAGESGSGKSTIAQAILRLLGPPAAITGGSIIVDGAEVLDMSEPDLRALRWRQVALVFQSALTALNPVMTVGDQIADAVLSHQGTGRRRARERAAHLLDLVGIGTERIDSYPHEFSGGMRQRAVIAIALALEPPLLLMDEPTTALDVVVQREILHQIGELKKKLGFSILFITHDVSLLVEISTRVAILYAGKLVEMADAKELLQDPRHPYTRGLLASSPSLRGPRLKLTGIGGSPPDMRSPPSGCRFHPRCPDVMVRCSEDPPLLTQRGAGRSVACHLYST